MNGAPRSATGAPLFASIPTSSPALALRGAPEPQGRLLPGLRAAVLAIAATLCAWPMTVGAGRAAALLGALAGAAFAQRVAASPLRLPAALLGAGAAALLATGIGKALVQLGWPGLLLGPVLALQLREIVLWSGLGAWAAFSLRVLSARRPALALLEVLFSALALALALAPHRQGLVHRPLVIGDWAWSRGIDPAAVLLALGALGTVLLAVFLLAEHSRRRLWLHLGLLAALGLALLGTVRYTGLPRAQAGNELGLTGEPAEAEPQPGEGDESAKPAEQGLSENEFPFRDNYSDQGGQAPVAVVLLHDDYSPMSDVYYFRQSALSQFNGNRLVQAQRSDADRDVVARFPARLERVPEVPGLEARERLDTSIGLLVDHVRPFALDSPESFAPLENPNSMRFVRVFQAISQVQTSQIRERLGRTGGSSEWSPELRAHYLQHPSDTRYGELAQRLMSDELPPEYRSDPLALALAIKSYLDEKGIYSLRSQHASAADPTASFLFGDLTGYCVHFAHAAVYLLRSLGVPSRVGVGYAVPESDRGQSASILIRALNAHAWPEIYLDGLGWTVVDLAPAQALDGTPTPPDPALQSMLGDMLRARAKAQEEYLEAQRVLPTLGQLAAAAAAALLVLLGSGLGVKLYRAWIPALASDESQYRLLYRASLDRLADVGARRRFGETREQFAVRIAPLAPSFLALTRQHLGWALGSRRLLRGADLRELRARLQSELRGSVPGWRRALGIINPFSWMHAR
jgi:transglutaminase-like putative cysteine protease